VPWVEAFRDHVALGAFLQAVVADAAAFIASPMTPASRTFFCVSV
jgi:hypothetical protein